MSKRTGLIKLTDYEGKFWCAGGVGIVREEVWGHENGHVVRYNLAFLMPHRFSRDNGRALGYDNAHGVHERHRVGSVDIVPFTSYAATSNHFYREVGRLRRLYENEDIL